MGGQRMVQKYLVLLRDSPDRQVWLGYDVGGRIGKCQYDEACRFNSEHHAKMALRALRQMTAPWEGAKILATIEEVDDGRSA